MNRLNFGVLLIGLTTLISFSCSSGKKALEKGNYDKAVFTAINRLKSNPDKEKAIQILKRGYDYALDRHLSKIEDIRLSVDPFKWEAIINQYQNINSLANAIQDCPVCMEAVPKPEKFVAELSDAKYFAAEARYSNAQKLFTQNNKQSARNAYYDFEKAEQLYPDYKDTKAMMDSTYWAGVVKVVVEPVAVNSKFYKLSNEYFQDKITEFMQNYERRSFVKFYSPQEAQNNKIQIDQILSLNFDDFVVGQTYVKERIEDITRDSVKIGDTRPPNPKPIYGTVNGKLTTFEKTVTSSGLLDFQIRDYNGKVVTHEKMPGTYVWRDTWATYHGDDRALTNQDKNLLKRRESIPPYPQDLFLEFTKPIFSQLVAKVNNFYSKY
ncbi:MAG: hypothetical protein H7098_13055 [Oligoflexus sp.]|nr:hypothetical protein [Pseudopedobacter sp.]